MQDRDHLTDTVENLTTVTHNKPTANELEDLLFVSKVCKHTKSNTIVLAKNKQLCASGTGQTSRVDALRQAIEKANSFEFDLKGSVMASDAFFPFRIARESDNRELRQWFSRGSIRTNWVSITAMAQPSNGIYWGEAF